MKIRNDLPIAEKSFGALTVSQALRGAILRLRQARSATPNLDAEVLLAFCMEKERTSFIIHPEMPVSHREQECFEKLLDRRCSGEPVAYLTGKKEFWSLPFKVDRRVLIPRPETEVLVEEALKFISPRCPGGENCSVLEIGTGSGAIVIALARELPFAKLTATDISGAALEVARENAASNGVSERIDFREGSFFGPVAGSRFDIIISNPPYVSEEEHGSLERGVRDFEPLEALVAGPDGTGCLERIIVDARPFLTGGGMLLLEIGCLQEQKIEEIFSKEGYKLIAFRKDYAGLTRAASARRM